MTRLLGTTLILIGCTVWGLVVAVASLVDEAAFAIDAGTGEVQLLAIELRIAPVLVVLAGVAVRFVPASLFVSRSYGALAMSGAALIVASGLLGRVANGGLAIVGAAMALMVVALLMVRMSIRLVGQPPSPEYAAEARRDVPRRFLLGISAILVSSIAPLEWFVDDAWAAPALPTAYEIAVPLAQVLLCIAALVVMAIAVGSAERRPDSPVRAVIVSAAALIVGLTTWLVMSPDGRWPIVVWGVFLVAVTVVAASTEPEPNVRSVVTRAGVVAVTFPLALIPGVMLGMTMSYVAFGFSGGEIGVDGLPLYLVGAATAVIACIVCSGVTPFKARSPEPRAAALA